MKEFSGKISLKSPLDTYQPVVGVILLTSLRFQFGRTGMMPMMKKQTSWRREKKNELK